MSQDSDLQDYADAPGDNELESDTDVEERDGGPGTVNAGVLGMLAQFSRTQTEKTGGAAAGL